MNQEGGGGVDGSIGLSRHSRRRLDISKAILHSMSAASEAAWVDGIGSGNWPKSYQALLGGSSTIHQQPQQQLVGLALTAAAPVAETSKSMLSLLNDEDKNGNNNTVISQQQQLHVATVQTLRDVRTPRLALRSERILKS